MKTIKAETEFCAEDIRHLFDDSETNVDNMTDEEILDSLGNLKKMLEYACTEVCWEIIQDNFEVKKEKK